MVTTARFENQVPFTIEQHLARLGCTIRWDHQRSERRSAARTGRRVARFRVAGVPVILQVTRHHDETRPDRAESDQYVRLVEHELEHYAPDVLIACNGHEMIRAAMAASQQRGVITVFTVRGYGYDYRELFEHVDHVFTCSEHLTRVFLEKTGLPSTPLSSPIDQGEVLVPAEHRRFLTLVNPSPHKGAIWFARLAQMLGDRRSDIPMMVVQSGRSAALLNSVPGVDFTRYPQIVAAPATPHPSYFLVLTRALLVPSLWDEPFGRVAVEAMVNGIPPLVSDRGALPDVVGGDFFVTGGGGRVLPIPAHITPFTDQLPLAEEVQPWFDAVCQLWDDSDHYAAISQRAKEFAQQHYSQSGQKSAHVNYLTGLQKPSQPLPMRVT